MALNKVESAVYKAGMEIQATLPPRTGVLLKLLVDRTGYSLPWVMKGVDGCIRKRKAHWPMKLKNRKKGGLRFWKQSA